MPHEDFPLGESRGLLEQKSRKIKCNCHSKLHLKTCKRVYLSSIGDFWKGNNERFFKDGKSVGGMEKEQTTIAFGENGKRK